MGTRDRAVTRPCPRVQREWTAIDKSRSMGPAADVVQGVAAKRGASVGLGGGGHRGAGLIADRPAPPAAGVVDGMHCLGWGGEHERGGAHAAGDVVDAVLGAGHWRGVVGGADQSP